MMETKRRSGGRPRDSFVDNHFVRVEDHEGNVIAKKCIHCDHQFNIKTSATRLKAHLGGVSGQGVAPCKNVPSDVKEDARNAMPGSSSNIKLVSNIPSNSDRQQPISQKLYTPDPPSQTIIAVQEHHSELLNGSSRHCNAYSTCFDVQTNPLETQGVMVEDLGFPEDMLQLLQDGTQQPPPLGCCISDSFSLIELEDTQQHFMNDESSLLQEILTSQDVLEVLLNTSQPNEGWSMSDTLASQHPMQQHPIEEANCMPYQDVLQDVSRMDTVHDATIPQNFLQGGVYPNILFHSTNQEEMPIVEFGNHEGPEPRHHMQENLQRDQRINSLDLDPYPSIAPQLLQMHIDPLLESLNVPTCTSNQDKQEKKRKLPDKSPIGKKLPLAAIFQGPTFNKKVDEIYASLEDDSVSRIGFYGMGGIGKTTIMKYIHNLLLEGYPIAFSHVIWVTVSQDHTVTMLQDRLASRFGIILPHDGDEDARVASLYEGMQNKCYALILDDVWDKVNLEQIGIPEPSHDNRCKLIVTTRSCDVCNKMQCKPISLDFLLEEEAWELFVKTLGFAPQNSVEEDIIKEVAKECARLPLAIVTVAGSMRGPFDVHEWRNALDSLRKRTFGFTDMEKQVMEKLKFSYYRLSKQLQECLLVCALFPEDYRIDKESLIKLLISKGITGSIGRLLSAYDHGYSILNKLVNACLLVECLYDSEVVVMHDLIRDMCLDIAGRRFFVKRCSEFSLDDFQYTEDVEKVSMIGSKFVEIPSHVAPYCPKLSTLLLSENMNLTRISYSFFMGFPSLQILDLSDTSIGELPDSIINLVSLNALVLQRCCRLQRLPCLAPLKALKKLDLRKSGIKEAPEGLEELVHLTYVDLHWTNIRQLPKLIFQKMVKLQHLDIGWIEITIDDVKELKNLEFLNATFATLEEFNKYVSSLLNCKQGPAVYSIKVSYGPISYSIKRYMDGTMGIFLGGNEDEIRNERNCMELVFPKGVEIIFPPYESVQTLIVENFSDSRVLSELVRVKSSSWHMLPIRMHHEEKTGEIGQAKGLFDAKLLPALSNVKELGVRHCAFMEELISTSPSEVVFGSSLEFLAIGNCDKFVRLLDPQFLSYFQNLITIFIFECMSLESIISTMNPIEKEESDDAVCFPKLHNLILADLENLRSIGDGTSIFPSIKSIHVRRCPKLKRLPLQLPKLDNNSGRLVPPQSSLKVICGEQTWWESLEWDHPHAKTILQPYFKPCKQRCYADYRRV